MFVEACNQAARPREMVLYSRSSGCKQGKDRQKKEEDRKGEFRGGHREVNCFGLWLERRAVYVKPKLDVCCYKMRGNVCNRFGLWAFLQPTSSFLYSLIPPVEHQ